MAAKDELGARGETLAVEHLIGNGLEILERNWRCPQGELDIVARERNEVVFVEVKTRSSILFGHPFESITPVKLARLRRLAAAWCEQHPGVGATIRIDAVAIIIAASGVVDIEHLKRVS